MDISRAIHGSDSYSRVGWGQDNPTRPEPTRPDPSPPDPRCLTSSPHDPTRPVRFRTHSDPTRLDPLVVERLLIRPAGPIVTREKPPIFVTVVNCVRWGEAGEFQPNLTHELSLWAYRRSVCVPKRMLWLFFGRGASRVGHEKSEAHEAGN